MINYELLRLAFNVTLRRSNRELRKKKEEKKKQKSSSFCLCSLKVVLNFPEPPPPHALCAICVDVEEDSLFYS